MPTERTPHLDLLALREGQSSAEQSVNYTLYTLDSVVHMNVTSRNLNDPPVSPVAGSRYLIGPAPTGAWTGKAGQFVFYTSGWNFMLPSAGWTCYVQNESQTIRYSGAAWEVVPVQAVALADLPTTVSNPPTQAEVQAVVTKVNALLAVLRTAKAVAT